MVSAADANRHFSKLLREVRGGATVVVTSHGAPVARIEPVSDSDDGSREEAWERMRVRAKMRPLLRLGRVTRDDGYDER